MNFVTIKLLPKAECVLLEDAEMRISWFEKHVPGIHVCRTVEEFKKFFEHSPPIYMIFFDHDLGPGGNGADAAQWFANKYGNQSRYCIIHSFNRTGAYKIQSILPNAIYVPFGDFDIEYES